MRIAIASDHAGYHLKNQLRDTLRAEGYQVEDLGADGGKSSDYPDYAVQVAKAVSLGEAERGVLICGTGVGMSLAANRVRGVRAAAVSEPVTARLSREHNDANVVCIGERIVGPEMALDIVRTFLSARFSEGERHVRRIGKITALDRS
ncbi:MAG TPA: ribose 5-phosphate isomerase B [Chthonomonadales bacterium]|nr:ribose 5-phosphate isomerase B [Chthonomonadales bacterium]